MVPSPRSKRDQRPIPAGDGDGPAQALPPGLYLLSTPIGAANDLTLRGRDALAAADVLACEDSRTLRRLMTLHGIALGDRRIIVYHDHNAAKTRPALTALLEGGASVVYASDAGTPLIADPGYRLAAAARAVGAPVRALPGASALLAALAVAGQPTDRFCFLGFPPPKSAARRSFFSAWRSVPATLVVYEAPHRLAETLADMRDILGDRPASIARELTKRFEEVLTDTLSALETRVAAAPLKGEIVLVIGPPIPEEATDAQIDAALAEALLAMTVKEAVGTVAERLHARKKRVYDRAIALNKGTDTDGHDDDA